MNLLSGGCIAVPTDGRMLQRRAGPRHRHYNQQCERPARLREHGPGQGAPGQHRQPAQLPDFRRLAALPRRHPLAPDRRSPRRRPARGFRGHRWRV